MWEWEKICNFAKFFELKDITKMRINRVIAFVGAMIFSYVMLAQVQHPENCPWGGVQDCEGQCGNFTDENKDGFCDYAVLTKQKKEVKDTVKNETKATKETTSKKQTIEKKEKKANKEVLSIENEKKVENTEQAETIQEEPVIRETQTETQSLTINTMNKKKSGYHLWSILIGTLAVYVVSVILVKKKVIKKVNQRRFWNVVLGLTCLVSCLIGVYVVLARMYGWSMNFRTLMLYHVDFGIGMTIIAIIHICWHINYWKNLFKVAGK